MKMIEQLEEMLEMQRALDEAIFKKHGIEEYPEENMKIALFVELGEMMNEFPTKFKHWKKTAKDDREKGLIEYVDALHFAMSLYVNKYGVKWVLREYQEYMYNYTLFQTLYYVADFSQWRNFVNVMTEIFYVGNLLGFEWEEIYNAYMAKNAENYRRLKEGY